MFIRNCTRLSHHDNIPRVNAIRNDVCKINLSNILNETAEITKFHPNS